MKQHLITPNSLQKLENDSIDSPDLLNLIEFHVHTCESYSFQNTV